MQWFGLEEEFLGVAEQHLDFDEMLGAESTRSNARHCAARIAGIVFGWLGAALIISPFNHVLNYNWFVSMMGGGLLYCAISLVACAISSTLSVCIIGVSWWKVRPRLATTLFMVVLVCAGITVALTIPTHSATAPPTVAATAPTIA